MRVDLDTVQIARDSWSISATGRFTEGIHLVSGDTGSGKTTFMKSLVDHIPTGERLITIEDAREYDMVRKSFEAVASDDMRQITALAVADTRADVFGGCCEPGKCRRCRFGSRCCGYL